MNNPTRQQIAEAIDMTIRGRSDITSLELVQELADVVSGLFPERAEDNTVTHQDAMRDIEAKAARIYNEGRWEKLPEFSKGRYRMEAANQLSGVADTVKEEN